MVALKRIVDALLYIFLNYVVAYIPIWTIRKLIYKLFGMKIGKGSRIYMKCIIRSPWNIEIGNNTVINENCVLDGRGGISIGDNVSISLFTTILSASHDRKSESFEYIKKKVVIENNVWIGVRAVVLEGTVLKKGCVLGAASSLKGDTEEGYIYVGVPAQKSINRELREFYQISHYDFFR